MNDETMDANKPESANSEFEPPEADDTVFPDEAKSAAEKLAKKSPQKLVEMMAMEMSSIGNPLYQRMTTEHVSQVLDLATKHDERQYDLHRQSQENEFKERKANRAYCFSAFVIIIALTVLVLVLFRDQPQILIPVLTGLGGLIGGFIGGWGLGRKQE